MERSTHDAGCLICGAELVYSTESSLKTCHLCHRASSSNVSCARDHHVCDRCHGLPGLDLIEARCCVAQEKDPIRIAQSLMEQPAIKMHGPEHHFLVPAVLLSARAAVLGDQDELCEQLAEARARSEKILGGFCGTHGLCGAAAGVGIFVSVATAATPLSRKEWRLSNLATAGALRQIALKGGPRCCKRGAFIALLEAAKFAAQKLDLHLPMTPAADVVCHFHELNTECLLRGCPFFRSR